MELIRIKKKIIRYTLENLRISHDKYLSNSKCVCDHPIKCLCIYIKMKSESWATEKVNFFSSIVLLYIRVAIQS